MTLISVRRLLMFSTMLAVLAAPAFAQDQKKGGEKKEKVVEAQAAPKGPTGPVKEWLDAENALIDPLSDKDKQSFYILRNKYSIIRVVRVVERDVESAVKACSKANPGMKEKMTTRFDQWKAGVNPIIDIAEKQLNKDLDAQKIVDVKKARNVLKLNDKAYEYSDGQITKKVVTSEEACQKLIESMDRTENNMIALLQKTLLPESTIRNQSENIKKQQQKSEAKLEADKKQEEKKADTKEAAENSKKE